MMTLRQRKEYGKRVTTDLVTRHIVSFRLLGEEKVRAYCFDDAPIAAAWLFMLDTEPALATALWKATHNLTHLDSCFEQLVEGWAEFGTKGMVDVIRTDWATETKGLADALEEALRCRRED
jgi:hypothetical protein